MSKPKYDVGFYNYPGGIQASNRAKTIYGDYEQLAFIAHSATNLDDINWEKEKLPAEIQTEIVDYFKDHIDAFKPEPPKIAKYTIEQIQEAFKNASNYPEPLQWAEKYGLVFRRSATQVHWTEKGIEYFDINGLWKSKRAANKTGPIKSFSEIAKLEIVMFQGTTAIMRGPSGRKFYTDSGFISPKVSSLSWPTEDDQQKVNKCIESNISTEMVATHSQYKATESTNRKRAQAKAKAAMVMISALKA